VRLAQAQLSMTNAKGDVLKIV